MARPLQLELTDSTEKRLAAYAKLLGVRREDAAVRAIENWLEDAGDLQTRIAAARRAHDEAMKGQVR